MYTPVSSDLCLQLLRLCKTGGMEFDTTVQFTLFVQGRIHDVYLVQTKDTEVILQRLNPIVIKDSSALEYLINHVLATAGITPELLAWPATDKCVLRTDTGHWIRRPYIAGKAMTTQLPLKSFEAMAGTLRQFHQSLSIEELNRSKFIGVNPWSGDATVVIENLARHKTRLTSLECSVVNRWSRNQQMLTGVNGELHTTNVVVHRDAKPSNFIQRLDGSLVLIDFDTIGVGDPALDLGELMRAWLSSDELEHEIESQRSSLADIPGKNCPDTHCLPVTGSGCSQALKALQTGYDTPAMTSTRIQQAAMRCCLWQCERYLEDHFAGDLYYSVRTQGDNLKRASEQLDAFELLGDLLDI